MLYFMWFWQVSIIRLTIHLDPTRRLRPSSNCWAWLPFLYFLLHFLSFCFRGPISLLTQLSRSSGFSCIPSSGFKPAISATTAALSSWPLLIQPRALARQVVLDWWFFRWFINLGNGGHLPLGQYWTSESASGHCMMAAGSLVWRGEPNTHNWMIASPGIDTSDRA